MGTSRGKRRAGRSTTRGYGGSRKRTENTCGAGHCRPQAESHDEVTENMFHNHRCHHNHDSRKHIFGTVKVGERGQIVIPKDARETFDIKPGDTLMIFGDEERGLAIVKADKFRRIAEEMLRIFEVAPEEPPEE